MTKDQIAKVREALSGLLLFFEIPDENSLNRFERVADVFRKETGYLRPGKDCRVHEPEKREYEWRKWYEDKVERAIQALQILDQMKPCEVVTVGELMDVFWEEDDPIELQHFILKKYPNGILIKE